MPFRFTRIRFPSIDRSWWNPWLAFFWSDSRVWSIVELTGEVGLLAKLSVVFYERKMTLFANTHQHRLEDQLSKVCACVLNFRCWTLSFDLHDKRIRCLEQKKNEARSWASRRLTFNKCYMSITGNLTMFVVLDDHCLIWILIEDHPQPYSMQRERRAMLIAVNAEVWLKRWHHYFMLLKFSQ